VCPAAPVGQVAACVAGKCVNTPFARADPASLACDHGVRRRDVPQGELRLRAPRA
jgi:hypothetical protein